MASPTAFSLILLALAPCLLTIPQVEGATAKAKAKAPAPAPAGLINLTAILDKSGQYTTLIRLLNVTQVGNQIENELNSSDQGITILAPTDNAFNNLKAGTLNDLSTQQQVDLVLYHVLPKYYSLAMFQTVSNPVRTQASGQEGEQYGLNITSSANQVNVSVGSISTQINNALRDDFPLAVYQLDKVLLPADHFVSKIKASPPPAASPPSKKSPVASAKAPASADADTNSGSKGRNLGLGVIVGICLMCLGML